MPKGSGVQFNKTILVCPLDWGLGHATRIVPVIDLLLKKGARVIIGADNRPLAYLKLRFPDCEFIKFPGYQPAYPETGSMALAMVKAFPKMKGEAKKANLFLQQLIIEEKIDIVISDNRYELYSKNAYTVFITHQLNIQTPGLTALAKPFVQDTIFNYIKRYDELWIPDFDTSPNLSGTLSHIKKMPIDNYHFIGPLSRFSLISKPKKEQKINLLIMLSGPEPQRTILEKLLIDQALKTNHQTFVLQGKPETSEERIIDKVHILPHLNDVKMAEMIRSAEHIICRPGYSTIMDLAILGKKAAFIPTPGQTEQEYLARHFKQEGIFYSEAQSNFDINRLIDKQQIYNGLPINEGRDDLDMAISKLLV